MLSLPSNKGFSGITVAFFYQNRIDGSPFFTTFVWTLTKRALSEKVTHLMPPLGRLQSDWDTTEKGGGLSETIPQ